MTILAVEDGSAAVLVTGTVGGVGFCLFSDACSTLASAVVAGDAAGDEAGLATPIVVVVASDVSGVGADGSGDTAGLATSIAIAVVADAVVVGGVCVTEVALNAPVTLVVDFGGRGGCLVPTDVDVDIIVAAAIDSIAAFATSTAVTLDASAERSVAADSWDDRAGDWGSSGDMSILSTSRVMRPSAGDGRVILSPTASSLKSVANGLPDGGRASKRVPGWVSEKARKRVCTLLLYYPP